MPVEPERLKAVVVLIYVYCRRYTYTAEDVRIQREIYVDSLVGCSNCRGVWVVPWLVLIDPEGLEAVVVLIYVYSG